MTEARKTEPASKSAKGAPALGADEVLVTITKAGSGQVFDGQGGNKRWKDQIIVSRKTGEALELRGFGEIEEPLA